MLTACIRPTTHPLTPFQPFTGFKIWLELNVVANCAAAVNAS